MKAPSRWCRASPSRSYPPISTFRPEALEVFLETFEGPLDLLLYLIRRQNLDILDIKVAAITEQYMTYIDMMHALQLELAGEYLVMAAMLAEIKSRMLLPRPDSHEDEEGDPRAELIRRLQEYEQIKTAADASTRDPAPGARQLPAVGAAKPELVRTARRARGRSQRGAAWRWLRCCGARRCSRPTRCS